MPLSALKYDMHTMREFTRRLAHFKQLASAGKRVRLVDRKGQRFIFEAEKPLYAYGAGKHLAKGEPLSAQRTPPEEWKGMQ